MTIAIAVSDATRPVPTDAILRTIMERLKACGFEPDQVTIMMGCGRHRPPREEEVRSILDPEGLDGTRFLSHSADKGDTVFLGTTSRGTPVNINRDFIQADLRVVTGMIEPHQFAGFSGGAKVAVIGLGNEATIRHNHSLLAGEGARAGVLDGNPVREDIEEAAQLIGIHFVVNVVMAPRGRILKAFAGTYPEAYREGVEFARRSFSVSFRSQCDVVVVSCGGYPRDIDLYQAQKALAHVEPMVRSGGVLVLVAECPEGTGDAQFQDWMRRAVSSGAPLEYFRDREFQLGAHKAYLTARTMMKAAVFLVSSLPAGLARDMGFEPFGDVGEALDVALTRLGHVTKVGIVPHGTGMILSSGH